MGGEIIQIEHAGRELLLLDKIRPYQERMQKAIAQDHDDEFVKLVSGEHDDGSVKDIGYEFSPSLIWSWIIEYWSLKCAQAVVSGKAGLSFNLNSPLTQKNSLPIDLALSKLGKAIDRTPSQPSYALIFKLCDNSLIVPRKIIHLLLLHLPIESTREVCYRYALQGWAIEMSVLLYVDGAYNEEKLALWGCEDFKALRQYIGEEILDLSEEKHKLAKSGEGFVVECMNKKKEKLSILQLLEIFQRTGFYEFGADPSTESVARRLRRAGFELNGEFKYILRDQPDSKAMWRRDNYESPWYEKKLKYLPSFLQPQGLLSTMVNILTD